jgi:hypothetical protein
MNESSLPAIGSNHPSFPPFLHYSIISEINIGSPGRTIISPEAFAAIGQHQGEGRPITISMRNIANAETSVCDAQPFLPPPPPPPPLRKKTRKVSADKDDRVAQKIQGE